MAKTTTNRRRATVRRPRGTRKRVRTGRRLAIKRPQLDTAARQWAELIADPCNAKLTNSIWPGTTGSFVARFETDYVLFSDATATAGVVVFVPGSNSVYTPTAIPTGDNMSLLLANSGNGPGANFLSTSAGSIRCVAACAQLSFPGTELNRCGVVGGGVSTFGTFAQNVTTAGGGGNMSITAAEVRAMCQHTERMPASAMEILWMPGAGDQDWFELRGGQNNSAVVDLISDKNCIMLSASGFPAGTGIRVRLVSVLEWVPKSGRGLVSTVEVPKSNNTINDVLRALPASRGTDWFINSFQKARPWLRAAGTVIKYGAKTVAPALMAL